MTKKEYAIRLEGVEAFDLPFVVLRDLCDVFVEGAQRCARLVGEGRSVARGTPPSWVTSTADIRVSRFESGSLALGAAAPRLSDVAPEIFAQQALFPTGTDPDATAIDLLLDAAEDAAANLTDSERLDAGVLEVLSRTGSLFARGGTRLTVSSDHRRAVVLDQDVTQRIRTLAEQTPLPRVARVRGILDSLTVSSRSLVLKLDDGSVLRGFAGAVPVQELGALLGRDVVVEGSVTYRPSGDPLRIEVEEAALAAPGDVLWARLPRVEPASVRPRVPTSNTGLDALFGKWPGDETDEEIAAGLSELS